MTCSNLLGARMRCKHLAVIVVETMSFMIGTSEKMHKPHFSTLGCEAEKSLVRIPVSKHRVFKCGFLMSYADKRQRPSLRSDEKPFHPLLSTKATAINTCQTKTNASLTQKQQNLTKGRLVHGSGSLRVSHLWEVMHMRRWARSSATSAVLSTYRTSTERRQYGQVL